MSEPKYAPNTDPNRPGCKPAEYPPATEELKLLRQMVTNQQQIIELLRDISMGLA